MVPWPKIRKVGRCRGERVEIKGNTAGRGSEGKKKVVADDIACV